MSRPQVTLLADLVGFPAQRKEVGVDVFGGVDAEFVQDVSKLRRTLGSLRSKWESSSPSGEHV